MLKATTQPLALTALLKVLADPTRLRTLGLLSAAELSVGELSRCLGLSQSRVSNHLRVLREHQLLHERHVGTSTFLRPGLRQEEGFPARLLELLQEQLEGEDEHKRDLERLRQVLAGRRSENHEFFDRVAGEWDTMGTDFASGQARQRVVANLLPPGLVLADLGCGTGYVGRALLGLCRRLICVDGSQGMLAEARKGFEPSPPDMEIEFRRGELTELPIEACEVDGAILSMVLHHLPELESCLGEVRRILKPGGTAVALELQPHRQVWLQEALGDRHLGLDAEEVARAFERAGFENVRLETVDDLYKPSLEDDNKSPEAPEAALEGGGLPLFIVRGNAPQH